MSDWTVHLEFEEGTSSKFWRARVEGKTLYVNYGKIGSNGQTQVKQLGDPDAAQTEFDKLVREKRKKGYVDAGGGGGGGEKKRETRGRQEETKAAPPARPRAAPKAAAPAGGRRLVLRPKRRSNGCPRRQDRADGLRLRVRRL
jgi:predicted DNA-binding WGR domain protein